MKLYARPYNQGFTGFYFESFSQFEIEMAKNSYEEYEIMLIEHDCICNTIFSKMNVNCGNIEESFEIADRIENLDDCEMAALEYSCTVSSYNDINQILDKIDDVNVFKGTLNEYAEELFHECYNVPDEISRYINYSAFAHDLECGGDCYDMGNGYIITNSNDV